LLCGLALCWPASAAQNAAPIPDFSGPWHRNAAPFEPPATGPGPVMSRTHAGNALAGDYSNPILKPEAAARVKQLGEIAISGVTFPDPHNQCQPEQPPYILTSLDMQMVQQRDQVTFLYMQSNLVRRVRLNAQHAARLAPSWYGDSVGHYEGDTLIVDTVGIKVGPLSMVDQFGTPQSERLHVVERYRLIDGAAAKAFDEANVKENGFIPPDGVNADPNYMGKGLRVEFTVEDPGVFTTPWSGAVTYLRGDGWVETVCGENTREYYANKDTAIPTAAKPDF
jgi:hypothetical protein